MRKICYFFHSGEMDTGIGRLASSIRDFSCRAVPAEATTITGDGIFNISQRFKFFSNFINICRNVRACDLVHVFDVYPYGFLAVVIAKMMRRPIVVTAVGTGSVKNINRFFYRHLFWFTLKNADKVVAISSYIKDKIASVFPGISIQVINPGIDYAFWSNKGTNTEFGLSLGKYILSVGTFKKRKGYEQSLEFFKKFSNDYPEYNYVIVSSRKPKGEIYKKVELLINKYNLVDRVKIISELSDEKLRSVYQGARFFILLSQEDNDDVEGFGLVFLEAAAARLPVIGANNSGASDAVRDGCNGYLVDYRQIDDILKKTKSIVEDKNLSQSMSDCSDSMAKESDWPKIIGEYVRIYRELMP